MNFFHSFERIFALYCLKYVTLSPYLTNLYPLYATPSTLLSSSTRKEVVIRPYHFLLNHPAAIPFSLNLSP